MVVALWPSLKIDLVPDGIAAAIRDEGAFADTPAGIAGTTGKRFVGQVQFEAPQRQYAPRYKGHLTCP